MALSFLFGKKKPTADTDSPGENKTSSIYDDYVVIERKTNPAPADNMYPMFGPGSSVTLPYQVNPSNPAAGEPPRVDSHSCNPLDDVPFKLNSLLSGGSCEWSRNDALHFKYVVSRAVHHNETFYKYDFSHEKSIMRESNQSSVDVG